MSKTIRNFQIAILNYGENSIKVFTKALPSDIQTAELEEILTIEGLYKPSECYLMFGNKLSISVEA